MTTVTGVFDSRMEANRAVTDLMAAGFEQNDISFIVSDKARNDHFNDNADMGESKTAEGGLTGAAFGGALGAVLAGLTLVGSIVIPGAGLLVAGPLAAALTGAGVGAAAGGLTGALTGAGLEAAEASEYEREITAGKAVIVVHTDENRAMAARNALRNSGATTKAA